MKKLMNLWKSTFSGITYQMPIDWMPAPQFGGWELIATIEVEV